jgi:lysophospholipase L1-like esterase
MWKTSLLALFLVSSALAEPKTDWKFCFGSKGESDCTQVQPTSAYSTDAGFGFEAGAEVKGGGDCLASDKPFLFSVTLPEGSYKISVTLGDAGAESTTTIKSEMRRLMLEKVHSDAGKFEKRTFTVNIRTPKIANDGEVKLKPRERESEMVAWDDKLTLEFNGIHPAVSALQITPANDLPLVYLLGDSTVCDQPREPWNSWGQMLPRFFKPDVVIANHAESGESIGSSLGAKRVAKILSTIKRGDYLFVQFGHNDMKDKSPDALAKYKTRMKDLVEAVKAKDATAVLVTSMERKAGVKSDTLGEYPQTIRDLAKEQHVTLIDLHEISKTLYKALGSDLDKAFQDGTHHNNYGSYELAKCIVEGIKKSGLPLKNSIVDDFGNFDPAHPDPVSTFEMAVSPMQDLKKPEGN